jgi:hypothetical protein
MVLRIDMKLLSEECKLKPRIMKKKPMLNFRDLRMITQMKCAKSDKRLKSKMTSIDL